jgi:flagellar protein FlgJ
MDANAGTTMGGLAADSHSLDKLRQVANQDPSKAVKEVSKQFEALFMQQVLKSMREASPKSGLFNSNEQDTYTSMLDEQIAQKIAQGGTGLAAVIERQLSQNLAKSAAAIGSAASTGTNPASAVAANAPGAMATANAASVAAAGVAAKSSAISAQGTASARRASSPATVLQSIRAAADVRSQK